MTFHLDRLLTWCLHGGSMTCRKIGRSLLSLRRLSRAVVTAPEVRPPDLSGRAVANLVKGLFPFKKVEESSVKQCPSYDDRNFYFRGTLADTFVHCDNEIKQGKIGAGDVECVLKINSTAFIPYELINSLNCIMNHLKGKGIECSYPLMSKHGKQIEVCSENGLLKNENSRKRIDNEREFGVRVLAFLPGEMMDEIDKRFVTPRLMYETGKYIGNLDAALQDFYDPAISSREFYWDLKHFLGLRSLLPSVEDSEKRSMAELVFRHFKDYVSPKISSLRQGVIHGDANGLNIVVAKQNGSYKVSGIIDFGDCVHTCYIFELAIMLAYAMVENENPLQLSRPMLSGYLQAFPMSEEELDCLYYCVLARLCQSAMVGEYKFRQEPWNTYLLTTPAKAWHVMREILATPINEVDRMWTESTQQIQCTAV